MRLFLSLSSVISSLSDCCIGLESTCAKLGRFKSRHFVGLEIGLSVRELVCLFQGRLDSMIHSR